MSQSLLNLLRDICKQVQVDNPVLTETLYHIKVLPYGLQRLPITLYLMLVDNLDIKDIDPAIPGSRHTYVAEDTIRKELHTLYTNLLTNSQIVDLLLKEKLGL